MAWGQEPGWRCFRGFGPRGLSSRFRRGFGLCCLCLDFFFQVEMVWLCFSKRWFQVYAWSVAQSCPTLCDPMDCIARQAPRSRGFSRQEYWSGLPFPHPRDLPDPGIEPTSLASPALAGGFFATVPFGFRCTYILCMYKCICMFVWCVCINRHTFFPPGFFCEGWKTKSPW